MPGRKKSNFQKSKRQIVNKKNRQTIRVRPEADERREYKLGSPPKLSLGWKPAPSRTEFPGKKLSIRYIWFNRVIQRENEITKSFLARPGCKPPRAYQEEWSPIKNWLESRFWYCESSFSFYPQKIRLLNKISSPTRENVTGRKCIFLPPSKVSSGLINIDLNDMMVTMTWWSWGWCSIYSSHQAGGRQGWWKMELLTWRWWWWFVKHSLQKQTSEYTNITKMFIWTKENGPTRKWLHQKRCYNYIHLDCSCLKT